MQDKLGKVVNCVFWQNLLEGLAIVLERS